LEQNLVEGVTQFINTVLDGLGDGGFNVLMGTTRTPLGRAGSDLEDGTEDGWSCSDGDVDSVEAFGETDEYIRGRKLE
jgi:hypothetical protein